jgi:PTS system cellobiose-specific IIC component
MACTTWFAISLGMVSRISALPPWTLPAPIGAYITTGGDWRAIILCLVNIAISCIIFYPFMKIFDKQQLDLEIKAELEEANAASA